jgi:hypothetical protein
MRVSLSILIGRNKATLYAGLQSYRVATGLVSVVIICYRRFFNRPFHGNGKVGTGHCACPIKDNHGGLSLQEIIKKSLVHITVVPSYCIARFGHVLIAGNLSHTVINRIDPEETLVVIS